MAIENHVIRQSFRALNDMRNNADLGRVVGRLPGSDGVQFITDANSGMLAVGVLETNAGSLQMVDVVIWGIAKVKFASACSAGYGLTVGTSGGVVPLVNITSSYVRVGKLIGPYGGTYQAMGNVSSDALGTCWVDFPSLGYAPVSTTGATVLQFV